MFNRLDQQKNNEMLAWQAFDEYTTRNLKNCTFSKGNKMSTIEERVKKITLSS